MSFFFNQILESMYQSILCFYYEYTIITAWLSWLTLLYRRRKLYIWVSSYILASTINGFKNLAAKFQKEPFLLWTILQFIQPKDHSFHSGTSLPHVCFYRPLSLISWYLISITLAIPMPSQKARKEEGCGRVSKLFPGCFLYFVVVWTWRGE